MIARTSARVAVVVATRDRGYVHLFRRSHVPPAGVGAYLVAVPGFVSDSYATLVMLRASLR